MQERSSILVLWKTVACVLLHDEHTITGAFTLTEEMCIQNSSCTKCHNSLCINAGYNNFCST